MAYGPEVDSGSYTHEVRFVHSPTGVELYCRIQQNESGSATEAQRDTVFQALVSKIGELPNTTIISALKTTLATSQCTP